MKRGEVWTASLDPRSGSEQRGTRPAIIVSSDGMNASPSWRSLIVIPCTTSERQRRRGPSVPVLPKGAGGLSEESVAICHQITTVDRAKLLSRLGVLSDEELGAVERGILAALDMDLTREG